MKSLFSFFLLLTLTVFGLSAPLSGTYTINSALPTGGTNFTSFNSAEDSLTLNGVSGPVIFLVKQGTYAEQVSFGNITGASASNTITFRADPTNTAIAKIEFNTATSSNNYVIQFNSASHFIIDSLIVSSSSSTYGTLINFEGNSTFIELRNNNFVGSLSGGSSTNLALINKGSGTTKTINNLVVKNNDFLGGSYGVYIYGGSQGRMAHFEISNNTILKPVTGFIYFNYCADVLVENNYCEDDSARTVNFNGFYATRADSAVHFRKNNIVINSTSGYIYGISVSYLFGSASHYTTIENNMIAMPLASVGGQYGIKVQNCIYQNIYHNSVKVNHTGTYSYALDMSGIGTSTYGKTNIVNNIFFNGQANYAFKFNNYSAPGYIDSLDHNIYYSTGSNPFRFHSTDYANLSLFQTATGLNANSLFGDPGFTSSKDLHLVGTLADNAGNNTLGITIDIDGDSRPFAGSASVDIGADEYSLISCPPPSLLSSILVRDDSVNLTWTSGPSDVSWILEYGTTGFSLGSGIVLNSSNDTLGFSGLSASTCYDVYLRSICSSDTSLVVGPFNFCTPCAPVSAPYTNDFSTMSNTAPPSCWLEGKTMLSSSSKVVEGYSAWTSDDFANSTSLGYGSARCELGYTNINDWLVSPVIDLGSGSGTNYQVEFKIAVTAPNATTAPMGGAIALDDKIVFLISTDYGTTWSDTNILRQWDTSDLPVPTGEYFSYDLTAAGYTGAVRFAFYTQSTINNVRNEVHIDDFKVDAVPTCPEPSLFTFNSSTTTSASFGWTNGANDVSWILEHGTVGFTPGNGTSTSISTSGTGNINGLNGSSLYDIYLKSICGAGDTSRLVGPIKFQTQCIPQTDFCENFEAVVNSNNLPVCWSTFTNSTTVGAGIASDFSASNSYSGNGHLLAANSTDLTSVFMIGSPEISNLASGTHRANFWVKTSSTSAVSQLIIGTTSNIANPANFVPLDTINLSTGYTNYKIDFNNYTGTNDQIAWLWIPGGVNNRLYFDEFCWELIPSCEKPVLASVLNSGIDPTSIDLGWTNLSSQVNYLISYGNAGYIPGVGTELGNSTTTNNFTTITGLNPVTNYCFWVRSVCSNGDTSLWEGPLCGVTGCPASFGTPFLENFSSYIPQCWEEKQGRLGSSGTVFSSATSSNWSERAFGNSGVNQGAQIQLYGTGSDEWFISPSIDLGNDPNKMHFIEFDYALTDPTNNSLGILASDDSVVFVVSYDDGATWSLSNALETWTSTSTVSAGTNPFIQILRNKTGLVKFGFYGASSISNNYARFHIDNFSVRDTVFQDIAENEWNKTFKVFPNPTQGLVQLVNEGNANNYAITVLDIQGRVVFQNEIYMNTNETHQFDLTKVAKGMYSVRIISDNKLEQHRIVVQ